MRQRVVAGLALAALAALAIGAVVAPESVSIDEHGPTTCPFKLATGQRCPLCGMTRASFRMARGDFAGALHLHPLAPLLLLVVGGGTAIWLACVAAGRPLPRWFRVRPRFAIPFVALVWAVNLLLGNG